MAMKSNEIAAEGLQLYMNFDSQKPDQGMHYITTKLGQLFDAKGAILYRAFDKSSHNIVARSKKYPSELENYLGTRCSGDNREFSIEMINDGQREKHNISLINIPINNLGVSYSLAVIDGISLSEGQLIVDPVIDCVVRKILSDYETSIVDEKTHTYNSNSYIREKKKIEEESKKIEERRKSGETITDERHIVVSFVDIFSLKTVNDKYGGHPAGDRYIVAVANAIKKFTDNLFPGGVKLFHHSGDEFVILAYADNEENAKVMLEILSSKLEEAKAFIEASSDSIVGCPGITSFDHGESYGGITRYSDIFTTADKKMYGNKERHHQESLNIKQP